MFLQERRVQTSSEGEGDNKWQSYTTPIQVVEYPLFLEFGAYEDIFGDIPLL